MMYFAKELLFSLESPRSPVVQVDLERGYSTMKKIKAQGIKEKMLAKERSRAFGHFLSHLWISGALAGAEISEVTTSLKFCCRGVKILSLVQFYKGLYLVDFVLIWSNWKVSLEGWLGARKRNWSRVLGIFFRIWSIFYNKRRYFMGFPHGGVLHWIGS